MLDKLKDLFAKNWKQYAVWLTVVLCLFVLNRLGYLPEFSPPSPPIPIFEPEKYEQPDGSLNFGYHADDQAVETVAASMRFPRFADTPAGKQANLPDHVYLWHLYPDGPPIKDQSPVGSCVSFGTNKAIEDTMAGQIKLGNAPEVWKTLCEEVTYAGSRVEIGGGALRGDDGSNGAWAVQFAKTRGVVPREVITTKTGKVYDLTSYDPVRCRKWGDAGVPDDLEDVARDHPVKDATLITSTDELKQALAQGYGVAVCSSVGFADDAAGRIPGTRDSRGVIRARGRWNHCMAFDGYHTENGQLFFHITNSWGAKAHKGPVGWGNPNAAGFWVTAADAERMITTGRCTWAFSGVRGFPARVPDWFLKGRDVRPDSRLAQLWREQPCSVYQLSP